MSRNTDGRDLGQPQAENPIRVLIVDDRPAVRTGLKTILEMQGGFEVVAPEGDLDDVSQACQDMRPHVVLLQSKFGAGNVGILVGVFKDFFPQVRIIVFSEFDPEEPIVAALRSGAVGYIGTNATPEEICACIQQVHAGKRYVVEKASRELLTSLLFGDLTERDRKIIEQLSQSSTSKQIAAELGVSESTVRGQMKCLLMKFNARTPQEAVEVAAGFGMVSSLESQISQTPIVTR